MLLKSVCFVVLTVFSLRTDSLPTCDSDTILKVLTLDQLSPDILSNVAGKIYKIISTSADDQFWASQRLRIELSSAKDNIITLNAFYYYENGSLNQQMEFTETEVQDENNFHYLQNQNDGRVYFGNCNGSVVFVHRCQNSGEGMGSKYYVMAPVDTPREDLSQQISDCYTLVKEKVDAAIEWYENQDPPSS